MLLADSVIVVCEESRHHVLSLGVKANKVKIIYNGVPDHVPSVEKVSEIRQSLGVADSGSILFGTVARLEEQKGLACMLNAFKGVISKVSNTKLCIVGDGSQGRELMNLTAQLGIAEKVIFMDWMPSYLDYVAAFDVFVLPSLCESFPFAIVEAMMAGKPVVASDVGGVSEAISQGETGLLIPPGDSYSLTEAILVMMESRELRMRMGERARMLALSKFSDKTMVRGTQELYKQLIAEQRDRRLK
jgi:glycosyltransferase involved in cell wall biosynthesis